MTTMWICFALAALCVVIELLTGTFYFLITAFALVMTGLFSLLGLSLYWDIAVFCAVMLVGVMALRKSSLFQQKKDAYNPDFNIDIGSIVDVQQWQAHGQTHVNFRGAVWQAQFDGNPQNAVPGPHQIAAIRGIVLILKPLNTGR
ncbi:NfeD family protein [Brackiella oedipodis]|uniref:NfeD family protein n=1 Tax=Brackiella oedipodis TaxID=124225 RepID=UPI00146FC5AB|nr:NfeD family protein [Brackiella oedipodis]